jgi:hypothetical protein
MTATAAGVCLALSMPSLAAAGTLDQSQPTNAGSDAFFGGQQLLAQIITVGLTGNLDQVDLNLRVTTPGTGTCSPGSGAIVTIRTVTAGVPSNTILASGIVPPASVPVNAFDFVSFAIVPPTPVIPGSQLAIVAAAPDSSCTSAAYQAYGWGSASGNPYAGGASFFKAPAMAWQPEGTYDFAFRTFVATPEVAAPEAQASAAPAPTTATGERAAALAKCKKKHSKKKRRKCRRAANLLPV